MHLAVTRKGSPKASSHSMKKNNHMNSNHMKKVHSINAQIKNIFYQDPYSPRRRYNFMNSY